jgi:hypothetical protein
MELPNTTAAYTKTNPMQALRHRKREARLDYDLSTPLISAGSLAPTNVSTSWAPHGRPQLLIERPKGEVESTKYWLATLPADTAFDRMVDLAKLAGASSVIIRN